MIDISMGNEYANQIRRPETNRPYVVKYDFGIPWRTCIDQRKTFLTHPQIDIATLTIYQMQVGKNFHQNFLQ
jgi:hypothetical protein